MARTIKDGALVALLGLGAGLSGAGCADGDVSVGQDSAAFNLGRCYGDTTQCTLPTEATTGVETGIEDCPEPQVGTLEEAQVFEEPPTDFVGERVAVGPDGAVWAVSRGSDQSTVVAAHWSPEGVFLGVSGPLAVQTEHTTLSVDLAVDGAGHGLVSIYSVYAPTADSELTERLTIHTLDSDLQAVREPLAFRGSGDSFLQGGAGDSFTLAGDARNNAAHGVLAHVSAGELDWIQSAVPSAGAGAGVGVSALAVNAEGETSVLAQRNPRWEPGTPDTYTYGIARFDQDGNLLWNLALPTAYGGGWRASMASTPTGDLVVRGVLASADFNQLNLVRLVTHEGGLGWGFRLGASADGAVQVDQTGRTITSTFNSVVVISADGQSCKQYGFPPPAGAGLNFPQGLVVAGSSVYGTFGGALRRYQLPAE
jgi:hypothetical protein